MFLKWLESRAPNRFGVKFISSSESSACVAGRARHGAGASLTETIRNLPSKDLGRRGDGFWGVSRTLNSFVFSLSNQLGSCASSTAAS